MPLNTQVANPIINVGPQGKGVWLQPGLSFGFEESGGFNRFTIAGTDQEVADYINAGNLNGWNYTLENLKGGLAKVNVSAGWTNQGGSEVPENIWELDPAETDKDLLDADFPNGSIAGLSAAFSTVSDMVSSGTNYNWVDASQTASTYDASLPAYGFDDLPNPLRTDGSGQLDDPLNISLPSADYASAKSLYFLIKKHAGFPIEASIIRHTQLVSSLYPVQASFNNCNRIISSANMIAIEGMPNGLLFSVPSEPSPAQFIETPGDLQYGWRKVRPAITRLSRIKWRIVQNYQFGLWAVKLYGQVL
jgi:hypothetical protein